MSVHSTNNKRIAKNTIFLYLRTLLVMGISLYSTRVLLRVLGVEDYGIYNVVCGFVALFSFMNTTMSNGIQRFYNFEAGKKGIHSIQKVFQTALIIQFILSAILLLFVEPLGLWYINNRMVLPSERLIAAKWIFQFSLLSLVFVVLQVPFSAAILAHEKMDFFASVGIIDALIKLGSILLLPVIKGDQLIIYGLLLFATSIVVFLLYFIYATHNFKELKLSKCFQPDLFKSIFAFTGWNLVEMFSWTLQNQGINLVMNIFCGPIANAAQGVASQISSALNSFCSSLSIAFRPQLVHSYAKGDYQRTISMLFSMSKAMFVLMTLMVIPLALEMTFVLSFWLGDAVPKYTIQFATLLLFSMLPRNMTMALSQVVHATGKMKNYQIVSAAIIILALPISFILLKQGYSPVYIYICNLFIFILLWIVDMFLLRKVFAYSIPQYLCRVIFPCLLTFFLSSISPFFIHKLLCSGIVRFGFVFITSSIGTVLFSIIFLLSSEEKKKLLRRIRREEL